MPDYKYFLDSLKVDDLKKLKLKIDDLKDEILEVQKKIKTHKAKK